MKVSINAISQAARDKQPADPNAPRVQKGSLDGSRFAFLCSMLDRQNTTLVDAQHDSKDSAGKPIPSFNEIFEIWFSAEENTAILAKLAQAKAAGQSLHFTFTCSSTSKGEVRATTGKFAVSQTIILNQDLSAPRTAQLVSRAPIQFV